MAVAADRLRLLSREALMMGEYFKPWQRKVGVLTLLIALVFMNGMLRSHEIEDAFFFAVVRTNFL